MTTLLSFDEAMARFDPVLGFEVHVELNTTTKMFSSAPNAFGDVPNSNVTEVDLGLHGVLPVVNYTPVESVSTQGLDMYSTIAKTCRIARKHYYYSHIP